MAETDERMIRVMNWKKPKKWISAMAVMVCVILLSGCAANSKLRKPDVALMEFPGVRWNTSPEEVVKALGFTEDQILEPISVLSCGQQPRGIESILCIRRD